MAIRRYVPLALGSDGGLTPAGEGEVPAMSGRPASCLRPRTAWTRSTGGGERW